MLPFTGQLKVIQKCDEEQFKINKYVYDVYLVEAGNLELKALFDIRYPVKEGDYIYSEDLYLTNFSKSRTADFLMVRVGWFDIIEECDYVKKDYFEIKCNGRIIKSSTSELRKIGARQKEFYACTISIKNEFGKPFNVLLVSFYRKAKSLYALENDSFANITAKLCLKRFSDGHELVLTGYDIVGVK